MDVNLPGSVFLRESSYGFPVLLTLHVVSMAAFLGLIIMMDLRLVGIGSRRTPFSQVQKTLFPWQIGFMVVTSIVGGLLFYSQPMRYYHKYYFWMKMGVMALAGLNAMVFHFTTYRTVALWDNSPRLPSGAKMAGIFSLVLWACVLAFGRLTAYNWLTTFD
jgi:hypothetical protein